MTQELEALRMATFALIERLDWTIPEDTRRSLRHMTPFRDVETVSFDWRSYESALKKAIVDDIKNILCSAAYDSDDDMIMFSELSHFHGFVAVDETGLVWGADISDDKSALHDARNNLTLCDDMNGVDVNCSLVAVPAAMMTVTLCERDFGSIPYVIRNGVATPAGVPDPLWDIYEYRPLMRTLGGQLAFGGYLLKGAYSENRSTFIRSCLPSC